MTDEDLDEKFERLQLYLSKRDEKGLLDVLFDLGSIRSDKAKTADEVVDRLLALLRNAEMFESPFAGHALMFFELQSASLTDRQKWLCIGFLNAHGNKFRDGFSSQIVGELRAGLYLKMKRPNPQQWDDYQRMKRDSETI